MVLQNQVCPLLFAAIAGRDAACHFKFQAVPGFFVDFTEETRHVASFRATTLPRLGLIERLLRYNPVKGLLGSWLTPDLYLEGGAPGYKAVGRAHIHNGTTINTINIPSCLYAPP